MSYRTDDTIVAIATAPGGAARGIVRISGPDTVPCVSQCFVADEDTPLSVLRVAAALRGRWRGDSLRSTLPCRLYLWPTSRSYTRQPLAEVHTIGSPPLLEAVVQSLCEAGARPANPGEFTLRAFLAGRLDLPQAEAVLGVIDARADGELKTALTQLAGGLSGPLNRLRTELLDLLAHLEAGLDFVDEDIEFISPEAVLEGLSQARSRIEHVIEQMTMRHAGGEGVRVVLCGAPNTGKSSLLNALAQDAAAIVSAQEGTTRDYVSCRIDIDGIACLLTDTAGADANVEVSSVAARAQSMTDLQAGEAQLQLLCLDASRPLSEWERGQLAGGAASPRIVVLTKSDLPQRLEFFGPAVATSSVTGEGLDQLRRAIAEAVATDSQENAGVIASTALRCRESLARATSCLRSAREAVSHQLGEELVAADVRAALDELGTVVGTVYTDDILDRIFSRFCIGK